MEKLFVFPLQQHIGAPAVPVVKKNDKVKRGQLLAKRPEDKLGANIFTSVTGEVHEVSAEQISIMPDTEQTADYVKLNGTEPLELIKEAGLVGLGGAGFPTYAKLAKPFTAGGIVIVNASECEPILSHNIDAIEHDASKLVSGLKIVMDIVKADRAAIAIKEIHEQAIAKLKEAIAGTDIRLALLKNIYPVGEERAIIREVEGVLLEVDQLPLAANAIVVNSESVCRIREAVEDKKPLIDKDMTVAGKIAGDMIKIFHDVPLGMSVGEMFKQAGGLQGEYGELVMGGPFTGKRTSLSAPIIKTTGGLLAAETFLPGPKKLGILVCACGANQERLEEIAASMGSDVVGVEFCKQAKLMKNGTRKCENPGKCPGQIQKVLALRKAGAQALLISNCTDCTNTVMSCAPQLKLPVYHCTDGPLRAVNHKLIRKFKG